MLRSLVNQRVILAETMQGGHLAMYSAVLRSALVIRSREEWERLRPLHRVPAGSRYDWKPNTRVKYLYQITSLRRLRPFMVPEGARHGYTWMEYSPTKGRKEPTWNL